MVSNYHFYMTVYFVGGVTIWGREWWENVVSERDEKMRWVGGRGNGERMCWVIGSRESGEWEGVR